MAADPRPDAALMLELGGLAVKLRAARLARRDLTQEVVARRLKVAVGTLREWEHGRELPTLLHLLWWARLVGMRATLLGPGGRALRPRLASRMGEGWAEREARRLATALRGERRAARRSQEWLAQRLGVARPSVNRWENSGSTPRVLMLAHWAAVLGCCLVVESAAN